MVGTQPQYKIGDQFRVSNTPSTFGIIIADGKAIIISGNGGSRGYVLSKVNSPPMDTVPVTQWGYEMPYPIKFALDAVRKAIL